MTKIMTQLYQVWSREFNDEKFCFNAETKLDAIIKLNKWANYHSINGRDFDLKEIESPKYKDNIHNEWVK